MPNVKAYCRKHQNKKVLTRQKVSAKDGHLSAAKSREIYFVAYLNKLLQNFRYIEDNFYFDIKLARQIFKKSIVR